MKEIYYTYNNEAIGSCVLLSFLREVKTLDIPRSCLILPFLLDEKTITYLLSNRDIDINLEELIRQKPRLFISFNKRYLSLLPVSINAIILLSKSKQIEIETEISFKSKLLDDDNIDMGNRYRRIKEALPLLSKTIENYSTIKLYQILNIQL